MRREMREFCAHLIKTLVGVVLGVAFGLWLPSELSYVGWLVVLALAFVLALITRIIVGERSYAKCFFLYGTLSYVLAVFLSWGIAFTLTRPSSA